MIIEDASSVLAAAVQPLPIPASEAADFSNQFLMCGGVPLPPALPSALVRLEVALNSSTVDLQAVSEAIRSDLGLAIAVLSRANQARHWGDGIRVTDVIVELGLEWIGQLAKRMTPLTEHPDGSIGLRECRQFWQRCRMTALVAEEFASYERSCPPDEAYLAGLFCHLSELPSLMAWDLHGRVNGSANEMASRLSRAWHLPETLGIGVAGDRCPATAVAKAADIWVERMEHVLGTQALMGTSAGA